MTTNISVIYENVFLIIQYDVNGNDIRECNDNKHFII